MKDFLSVIVSQTSAIFYIIVYKCQILLIRDNLKL